jgi:hypothetical protein
MTLPSLKKRKNNHHRAFVKHLQVRRDQPNPTARPKSERKPVQHEKNLAHENDLWTLGHGVKRRLSRIPNLRSRGLFGLFATNVIRNTQRITYFGGKHVSQDTANKWHIRDHTIRVPDSGCAIIGFDESDAEDGLNAGSFVIDPRDDDRPYNAKFEKITVNMVDSMVLVATAEIDRGTEIYACYGPAAAVDLVLPVGGYSRR